MSSAKDILGVWFREVLACSSSTPSARLYLFPHAGGSIQSFQPFYSDKELASKNIEIHIASLPGRAYRMREKPVLDMSVLLEEMYERVYALEKEKPAQCLFLYGYSFGGLCSYEIARRLERDGVQVDHLFLAGCGPPHLKKRFEQNMRALSMEGLVDVLRKYDVIDAKLLENQDLMDLIMPYLRADLVMNDEYLHEWSLDSPLRCGVSVSIGDQETSAEYIEDWGELTNSTFALRVYPGTHGFVLREPSVFTDLIDDILGVMNVCVVKKNSVA